MTQLMKWIRKCERRTRTIKYYIIVKIIYQLAAQWSNEEDDALFGIKIVVKNKKKQTDGWVVSSYDRRWWHINTTTKNILYDVYFTLLFSIRLRLWIFSRKTLCYTTTIDYAFSYRCSSSARPTAVLPKSWRHYYYYIKRYAITRYII